MFCDYTLQIPRVGAYHQALLEWILRYPERTGNPRGAIASFEAIKLEHTPPAPGETHATEVRRSVFLKWPHYRGARYNGAISLCLSTFANLSLSISFSR